ncbi:MAG: hypothetical protein CMG64_02285 [Candidatus Marinimicrobia bacterium]|nr:hypothetical protein [Candidatus Neomarinimicrobiota bacterium]|tara:strand:+ start:12001 stop:12405 length:405 start_codon:yes stop_codon:yes gene_type:complete
MNKLIKIRQYMILTSLIGLFAMSCAPNPINVIAVPASQSTYMVDYYTCDILQLELGDAESQVTSLTGMQHKAFKSDKVVVGCTIGIGFIFLGLLGLAGLAGLSSAKGTDKSQELGLAKGKVNTIQKVMQIKGCQ